MSQLKASCTPLESDSAQVFLVRDAMALDDECFTAAHRWRAMETFRSDSCWLLSFNMWNSNAHHHQDRAAFPSLSLLHYKSLFCDSLARTVLGDEKCGRLDAEEERESSDAEEERESSDAEEERENRAGRLHPLHKWHKLTRRCLAAARPVEQESDADEPDAALLMAAYEDAAARRFCYRALRPFRGWKRLTQRYCTGGGARDGRAPPPSTSHRRARLEADRRERLEAAFPSPPPQHANSQASAARRGVD